MGVGMGGVGGEKAASGFGVRDGCKDERGCERRSDGLAAVHLDVVIIAEVSVAAAPALDGSTPRVEAAEHQVRPKRRQLLRRAAEPLERR